MVSIEELFGNLKEKVSESIEDAKKVGVPALQNAAEQWAANVLQEQKDKLLAQNVGTQETLKKNLNEVLKEPSEPGSFGSFFANGLGSAAISNYGLYIIAGVIGVGVVGYVLLKK